MKSSTRLDWRHTECWAGQQLLGRPRNRRNEKSMKLNEWKSGKCINEWMTAGAVSSTGTIRTLTSYVQPKRLPSSWLFPMGQLCACTWVNDRVCVYIYVRVLDGQLVKSGFVRLVPGWWCPCCRLRWTAAASLNVLFMNAKPFCWVWLLNLDLGM